MAERSTCYCSFCGKSEHEVAKLIAGPTVFICDGCTGICADIVAADAAASPKQRTATDAIALAVLNMPMPQRLPTATAMKIVEALTEAGYAIVPADAFHALDASHVALDDWLHTYAPDECRDEHVQASRARIFEAGGTLAYIADVQQENRRVLKGMWEVSAPIDSEKGE